MKPNLTWMLKIIYMCQLWNNNRSLVMIHKIISRKRVVLEGPQMACLSHGIPQCHRYIMYPFLILIIAMNMYLCGCISVLDLYRLRYFGQSYFLDRLLQPNHLSHLNEYGFSEFILYLLKWVTSNKKPLEKN